MEKLKEQKIPALNLDQLVEKIKEARKIDSAKETAQKINKAEADEELPV
jgi:hypothetical protein